MVAIVHSAVRNVQLGISRFIVARDELLGIETAETEHHRWQLALHAGIADFCRCCERIDLKENLVAGTCDSCEEAGRGMIPLSDVGTPRALVGHS